MYIYVYTCIVYLAASGRGQDERGRRRSAAIPPNEPSQEDVTTFLN